MLIREKLSYFFNKKSVVKNNFYYILSWKGVDIWVMRIFRSDFLGFRANNQQKIRPLKPKKSPLKIPQKSDLNTIQIKKVDFWIILAFLNPKWLAIHWTWARCVEFNHLFSRTHFTSNYRFVASRPTVLLFPPLPPRKCPNWSRFRLVDHTQFHCNDLL